MKKKVLITEKQAGVLTKILIENNIYTSLIKQLKSELDGKYVVEKLPYKQGGDYKEKTMFKIVLTDEIISPNELFNYLKFKFDLPSEFVKQFMNDWVNNRLDDNMLSKNVNFK